MPATVFTSYTRSPEAKYPTALEEIYAALEWIAAQVLYYPVTNADFDTDSYHQFATGYWLRRDGMQWFWDQYTADAAQRTEITAAPLRASLDELAGLPPALVMVGEADVLRDEGEAYSAKLREAGVPVTAVRFQGIIHDFVMVNAMRDTHAAKAATAMGRELTTIAAIAYGCGFANLSHFSQRFREAYGMPPREWRLVSRAGT